MENKNHKMENKNVCSPITFKCDHNIVVLESGAGAALDFKHHFVVAIVRQKDEIGVDRRDERFVQPHHQLLRIERFRKVANAFVEMAVLQPPFERHQNRAVGLVRLEFERGFGRRVHRLNVGLGAVRGAGLAGTNRRAAPHHENRRPVRRVGEQAQRKLVVEVLVAQRKAHRHRLCGGARGARCVHVPAAVRERETGAHFHAEWQHLGGALEFKRRLAFCNTAQIFPSYKKKIKKKKNTRKLPVTSSHFEIAYESSTKTQIFTTKRETTTRKQEQQEQQEKREQRNKN